MNTSSKSLFDGSGKSSGKAHTSNDQSDRQTAAETLIGLAEGVELFHTATEVPYAVIMVNGHREVWSLRSTTFRTWLVGQYFALTSRGVPSEALKTALGTLEAKARFDGQKREVHTRVTTHEGRVYLDLGDEAWRAVEIDASAWRIVDNPPVYFRRAPGMLSLPEPVRGGSINTLRPYLNLRSEDDFVLIVCWLLACLRGGAPFPLLILLGEQGSSKSTLAKILRRLIDPNDAPLRALPKQERDLFISANNAYLLAYDNLSGLQAGMSDLLCTLSTGGGFSTRQLYSDEAEAIFKAARPLLLNGIDDVVRRPDLADRSIFINLEPIPEERRRTEKELWADFDRLAPRVLGALLDGVVTGLRRQAEIRLPRLPRMADFAIWSTAVETAYWLSGTFWAAYEANRTRAIEEVVEGDLVAATVVKLLARRPAWTGTASELQRELQRVDSAATGSKEWPKDARSLSAELRRAATFLRKLGIEYRVDRQGHHRKRVISLHKADASGASPEREEFASAPSAVSAEVENSCWNKGVTDPKLRTHPTPADASTDELQVAVAESVRTNPLNYKAADDADDADDADAKFEGFSEADEDTEVEWSAEI